MKQTIEPEVRFGVDNNGVPPHFDLVDLPKIGALLIERDGSARVFDRVSGLLLFEGGSDDVRMMLDVLDPSRNTNGYEMDGVA